MQGASRARTCSAASAHLARSYDCVRITSILRLGNLPRASACCVQRPQQRCADVARRPLHFRRKVRLLRCADGVSQGGVLGQLVYDGHKLFWRAIILDVWPDIPCAPQANEGRESQHEQFHTNCDLATVSAVCGRVRWRAYGVNVSWGAQSANCSHAAAAWLSQASLGSFVQHGASGFGG